MAPARPRLPSAPVRSTFAEYGPVKELRMYEPCKAAVVTFRSTAAAYKVGVGRGVWGVRGVRVGWGEVGCEYVCSCSVVSRCRAEPCAPRGFAKRR